MDRKSFSLDKVKIDKTGLIVNYSKLGSDESIQRSRKAVPHPDLKKALAELAPMVLGVFDMDQTVLENLEVRGVTLVRKKSTDHVIVTAVYTTSSGAKTTINTPLIDTEDQHFDDTELLPERIENIIDETFKYLFEGKEAQLSIPMEEEDLDAKEKNLFNQDEKSEEELEQEDKS